MKVKTNGFIDKTGMKFNDLTVIEYSHAIPYTNPNSGKATSVHFWHCVCVCGNKIIANGNTLSRGGTKSCGCLHARSMKNCKTNALETGEAAFNDIYRTYSYSAKKRNYIFDLTKDEFKEIAQQLCFYCNKPPQSRQEGSKNRKYHGSFMYNGIDRVVNSIGYTKNNCVSCCKTCNRMKMDKDIGQFLDQVHKIIQKLK